MQIFGAVFVMAAALGIGGFVIARGRGRTLGVIGLVTGMLGAITLLVVLGFELAVLIALKSATDKEAAVAIAVALFNEPVFLIPLLVGLGGYSLALPILAFALWRSRMLPIIVPLLFVLPPLFSLVPLFAGVPYMVLSLLVLLPCVWTTVQLIRGEPVGPVRSRARRRPPRGRRPSAAPAPRATLIADHGVAGADGPPIEPCGCEGGPEPTFDRDAPRVRGSPRTGLSHSQSYEAGASDAGITLFDQEFSGGDGGIWNRAGSCQCRPSSRSAYSQGMRSCSRRRCPGR